MALAQKRGEAEISTNSLMLAMLGDASMQNILARLGIDGLETAKNLQGQALPGFSLHKLPIMLGVLRIPPSGEFMQVIGAANTFREKHSASSISSLDIFAGLFAFNQGFKKLILDLGLDQKDLADLADWYEHIEAFQRSRQEFWTRENLVKKPPIGKDWIYGYSERLKRYAVNLTDQYQRRSDPFKLVNRKKEIDQMEEILSRAGENNILLVGEEGVGKKHIIEEFAQRIAAGHALPALNYKQVFALNLAAIASSSPQPTEVQNNLTRVLNEAMGAGNIILVIEGLHNFVGALDGMGRIDVTEILVPYLQSTRLQVVATTDPASFHKHIESRQALLDVFERVAVDEPDATRTVKIVQESLPAIEYQTRSFVSYGALKAVIDSAEKYLRATPFPEKAFSLLSESIAYTASHQHAMVTAQDVHEVVSRKTGIPLGPIEGEEKERLMNMETLMRQELVGQDRAIEVVSATMRRLRTGMARKGKPAGVFLFVGPTGVGKTETAKILARVYYGSEERMLRFDMSEFQELQSLDQFLGSLRLNQPGQFTTAARDNPFALILLDELEKANKNVLNIFLQVFDEAHLTDAFGRKVSFEQHIIIATSNAGADLIRQMVQEGTDPSQEREKIMDALIQGHIFTPEFLNRFDEIVIFHPLGQNEIYQVAEMAVKGAAKRLLEQDYIFKPTQEIIQIVAQAGFDPQFGARPIQRAVKEKIENTIAEKILNGAIQKGQEFELSAEELTR